MITMKKEWYDLEISPELMKKTIMEQNKVIEVLNARITRDSMDYDHERVRLEKEIERLHSIIKEVREYIEENDNKEPWKSLNGKKLLKILDKENTKE